MKNHELMKKGMVASLPMIVGGIPFGILFGSLAMSNGLSPWFAIAMSSIVFAGSAQFVALGLILMDAPLWVIISTTFIVNLRHILYAADLIKFVKHLPMKWRLIIGFGLVDESYAAVRPLYGTNQISTENGHYAFLGSFLSFYLMWQAATILGVVAGELIPGMSQWGLEFAMVATFIGIITPYLKKSHLKSVAPYWVALISASVASLVLNGLPNNLGLLFAALVGVLMGYIASSLKASQLVSEEG